MVTHSHILAWRIPLIEEPDWLQFMASQRLGQDWATNPPTHPPGHLPNPGIKPTSPALAGEFITTEPPGKCQQKRAVDKKFNLMSLGERSLTGIFFTSVQIEMQVLLMLVSLVCTFMEVEVIISGMLVRLSLFSLTTLVFWESLDTSYGSCFPQ